MRTKGTTDAVDLRILSELQENARLSHSELGRRVGLSQPAITERVRRLEEEGVISGYRLDLNLDKIGLPIVAFIQISTTDVKSGHIDSLAWSLPEVLECHRITGVDSYMMKVALPSIPHLESLIRRLLAYGHPTTSIVLSSPVVHRVVMPGGPAHSGAGPPQGT